MNWHYNFPYSVSRSTQDADGWASSNLDRTWKLLQISGFFVALALSWFFLCLVKARKKFIVLGRKGIPIPRYSYLLGHLPVVLTFHREWAMDANLTQTLGLYIANNWQKFYPRENRRPPIIYLDLWPIAEPLAISIDVSTSNQMVFDKMNLPKSHMEGDYLIPLTKGKDFGSLSGNEWRFWRTTFNPTFGAANIAALVPAICEEVETFTRRLEDRCGDGNTWGQVFPFENVSAELIFDITGRVVIGKRLNTQSASPELFSSLFRAQLTRMEITLNPLKVLWRWTPMSKGYLTKKRDEMLEWLRPFILESFKRASSSEAETIVEAAAKETRQNVWIDKVQASCDESFINAVFYQLMICFFASDDAPTSTIPWLFEYLHRSPESLMKLRAEHDSVFGTNPEAAAKAIREEPELLNKLPYTTAVIKETIRLSPATTTIREGHQNFNFHITGFDERWPEYWPSAGFDLLDSPRTIHTDPNIFPKPHEFIPERYLVADTDPLYPPPNAWRGFQLGQRRCIGQVLAYAELKLVLALATRRFDIEPAWEEWDLMLSQQGKKAKPHLVEGERLYITGNATSHPKDGAPVHVRARTFSA
ncbi:Cytochrome P450 protein [Rutstroemia sp. NJR-2017a BVV2]|nr:Cytochrome P450 protein [Rutstroemia sp. NJR-2017a BVV2]